MRAIRRGKPVSDPPGQAAGDGVDTFPCADADRAVQPNTPARRRAVGLAEAASCLPIAPSFNALYFYVVGDNGTLGQAAAEAGYQIKLASKTVHKGRSKIDSAQDRTIYYEVVFE